MYECIKYLERVYVCVRVYRYRVNATVIAIVLTPITIPLIHVSHELQRIKRKPDRKVSLQIQITSR